MGIVMANDKVSTNYSYFYVCVLLVYTHNVMIIILVMIIVIIMSIIIIAIMSIVSIVSIMSIICILSIMSSMIGLHPITQGFLFTKHLGNVCDISTNLFAVLNETSVRGCPRKWATEQKSDDSNSA